MAHASKSAFQLTALALALASIGAHGATPVNWATDTSGNWSIPTNWTPTGLPDSTSDVTIVVTGAKTITHDTGNDTINSLHFSGSNNFSAYLTVSNGSSITVNNGGSNGSEIYANGGTFNLAGGTLINTGYLQALNGGAINITNATVSGGYVESVPGGTVTFSNATMAGGTLIGLGGSIIFTNSAVMDGLNNGTLTNNGNVQTGINQYTYALGNIQNNGNITIGNQTFLQAKGTNNLTFTGTGSVTLSASSILFAENSQDVITNSAGHTIQGQGQIGANGAFIVNQGTIVANGGAGTNLIIDPTDGANGLINTGTLRADGATLTLQNGTFNNQGGLIQSINGGNVVASGATIQGGTLSGVVQTNNSSLLDGSTHGAITNSGALTSMFGQFTYAQGSIVNNGSILIDTDSDLQAYGASNLTFNGNGTIALNAANSRVLGQNNTDVITFTAGQAVSGQGQIGANSGFIVNQGTITSTTGTGLVIDPTDGANGVINTGTLTANGANLTLQNGTFNNQGGLIQGLNGSNVVVSGATIQGGTLATTGASVVQLANSSLLDGSTHGAITNSGALTSMFGQFTYAQGSIVNNGSILIDTDSDLQAYGASNLTFNGNGTIALNAANSRVLGQNNTDVITFTAGQAVSGQGQIGANSGFIVNQGTITSTTGTGLVIDPTDGANGVINTGTLTANGANLTLQNGTFNNQGGLIQGLNGSNVVVSGATIQGGTLATTGASVVQLANSSLLDGSTHGAITNNGAVELQYNQFGYAQGSIVNNGIITVDQAAYLQGNMSFSGNGTVTLAGPGSRLYGINATDTVTNGTGHTINGQGFIGANNGNLVNAGTISANVNGATLNVQPSSTLNNQSTGTLLATNGGTLNVLSAVSGSGTIRSDAGSTVMLNQASTTGQLINNGNLNLGGQLVTVSSDYNNANFGVGNAFNRNANVTGLGAIVASGNVAVGVTGTNVTSLASGGSALTIGNVRVGANTYNYQIANTGDNGPAIRGAIQTQFSGGSSITDSRLSGSGVTAGNYGPVAAGASSGNYGVTFTAATAGVLAPLANSPGYGTGQAVFIADNFANVAGQVLQINLASGAAAYNAAVGSTTPTPVTIANQRVGGAGSQALTVNNVLANGQSVAYTEALNASISNTSGMATASGSATNIIAGGNNVGGLVAGVDTSSAGAKSGSVTIAYQSDGTGSNGHSGLSAISAGSQVINVTGNVYNTATGSTTPTPVTIANQRVGGTGSQALTVSNVLANGQSVAYTEALNASIGATSGTATGSGMVTNILAGSNNTGGLVAGVDTSTAGAKSGSVTIAYQSDGTGSNGHSGLAAIGAGSQVINVSGNVYNTAIGSITPPGYAVDPVIVANQRVGGTNSTALTVSNVAAAGNYTEALNAAFAGASGSATNNNGSVSNIAAGTSNNTALAVGVNTSSSGAKTGSVAINYQSDGTGTNGHSGLAAISAGGTNVAVSGNVYQTAAGTVLTAPLNFGVVQVGQVVSQTLSIQNSATGAAGYVEDLNASFGAATGTGANKITGTGSLTGLAAGATNSSALTVGVNTSSAGTVNGSIAVNYFSAGTVNGNSNGLGTLALGSSNYGVSGAIQGTATVVDQAAPVINNSPIALGNVRIGSTSPTGFVSVTNQATGNQQAALNASIMGNAPVIASGSFNGLAPGATNNTNLAVGIDTSSAGAKNGTATIAFVSDASNQGCTTACQMQLASQNVSVSGAVYRLANPTVSTTPITVAARVGGTGPTTSIGVTNASPDVYTEGLSVSRGATSAGFTSSGGITNLVAGGSSSAIGVTLNTTTAGTFTGTQTLNYVSTGAGTDGAADLSVGTGSVALNGKVYTTAIAQSNAPSPIDFGIVHVGDTATKGVSVTNAAATTALNDVLVGSAVGATGPFSASGTLGAGLAAQQTSTNGLQVGLNTSTAGTYSGSATFSAASHDADLSDAALANLAVSLVGQVNNYASDTFSKTAGAGTLTRSGSTYYLDYGTLTQNTGTVTSSLVATNDAIGTADALNGSFEFLDDADFGESGFAAFMNLAAGMSDGPLSFSFNTATVGTFMDSIVLHGVGSNASGYMGMIGDIELIVRGTVNAAVVTPPDGNVPEPDSLLLLGLGLPLLFLRRGRKLRAH